MSIQDRKCYTQPNLFESLITQVTLAKQIHHNMANTQDLQDFAKQVEEQDLTLCIRRKQLDERNMALNRFEAEFLNKSTSKTVGLKRSPACLDLHAHMDLFTHSIHLRPNGERMGRLERQFYIGTTCRACHNVSLAMNAEDWEPINHNAIIYKFPALKGKQQRDKAAILNLVGQDGSRGQDVRVAQETAQFYMSDDSDSDEITPPHIIGCRPTLAPLSRLSGKPVGVDYGTGDEGTRTNGKEQDQGTDKQEDAGTQKDTGEEFADVEFPRSLLQSNQTTSGRVIIHRVTSP